MGQLAARIGFFEKVDFFLGKVERRFDQHAQADHLFHQFVDGLGERARQRRRSRLRRRLGGGVDQVGNRLGLGQVELVVQIGTAREFARLGQA